MGVVLAGVDNLEGLKSGGNESARVETTGAPQVVEKSFTHINEES